MFLDRLDNTESDNQIEKGLQVLGLEYRTGNGYYQISCPYAKSSRIHKHGTDNDPSFVIKCTPYQQYARCFTCGIQFEVADFFVQTADYLNNPADFEYLEFYFPNIVLDSTEDENPILDESILQGFTKSPKIAEYLASRNIDNNSELLYDKEEKRLVYPIRNEYNLLVGATSRAIDSNPYKSHHYFGIQTGKALAGLHDRNPDNSILIVEGLTDLLNAKDKVNKLNLKYDVFSTLTCSLTEWQGIKLIDEDRPIYMAYDMDKAGRNGQYKALKLLNELGANTLVNVYWKDRKLDVGDMSYDQFDRVFR